MGQGQPFRLSPRPASWSCLLLIVEAVRNISLPIHAVAILSRSKSISGGFKSFPEGTIPFFPRASERRVLLKVEVCYTSSHVHILTSSHLHIFTNSLLHIFTSSYLHILTSSHLLVFLASHPHIFTHLHTSSHSLTHLHTSSLSLSLPLSLSLALCHGLSPSFLFSLKAAGSADEAPQYDHPFARNEVRVKSQKLMKFLDSTTSAATLSHETSFECQKLMFFCEFGWSGGNPFARNDV